MHYLISNRIEQKPENTVLHMYSNTARATFICIVVHFYVIYVIMSDTVFKLILIEYIESGLCITIVVRIPIQFILVFFFVVNYFYGQFNFCKFLLQPIIRYHFFFNICAFTKFFSSIKIYYSQSKNKSVLYSIELVFNRPICFIKKSVGSNDSTQL